MANEQVHDSLEGLEESEILRQPGNESSLRLLIAGACIVLTVLASVCKFYIESPGAIYIILASTVVLNVIGWILWKKLARLAWLSMIPAAIAWFMLIASWIYGIAFIFDRHSRDTFAMIQANPEYFKSSNLVADSVFYLIIVVVFSAALILVAAGLHWLSTRPAKATEPAKGPLELRPRMLMKQVGTANDGSPIFEAIGSGHPTTTPAGAGQNIMAVLALVFGVLGGIVAIPFGHIGLSQIKRSGERGRSLAVAGLVLGYTWLAAVAIYAVVIVVLLRL
ncbi:DUF4190 domain-containing protein [Arthrobacter sp. CJ23]|uniref:DUF4190 domain-containing protein n=1 Tax=Arthrobacter sp. CJ23 TaxID=2972479 RepID=UPI00215C4B4E|nr:DUF4190 domain-containing protein [Arthrobacter sp. CJ23]UVJ38047.1 DUF4190 domain-containing protein [Arthrobacter sp. CJ23]